MSVIVPTYNHARYLPEAINSVLQQSFQDYEVIVVDDGSTDNTRDVVAEFTDKRIHYIYQKNKGLAGARNTGLREARGEFVAFLDADDLYLPCKLEVQVRFLTENPDYGFVAGGWNYIDHDGKIIGGYNPWPHPPDELSIESWLYGCRVNPVAVFVCRSWVEKVGGFDESLRQVEDWDMWSRLAYAGCKMGWVDGVVCSYRYSPGQMTKNAAVQTQSGVQMLDKFFSQKGIPEELLSQKNQIYSRQYLLGAWREFAVGQIEDGGESLERAIDYDPRLRTAWDQDQLKRLIYTAENPAFNLDGIKYGESIFNNLPENAAALRARRRWVMGQIGLITFYKAYKNREWKQVQRSALTVAINDPVNLFNRGAISIVWQSMTKHE